MKDSCKKIIENDLFRYFGDRHLSVKQKFLAHFIYPETRFIIAWRKFSYYKKKKNGFLSGYYKFILVMFSYRFGFQFNYNAEIGSGLYIGHFGRVILGAVKIGKNFNVATGVTIGEVNGKCPVIGDNVWVGTNAVIVGDIVIGDNVLISPNTFLYESVPSNSTVRGNPAVVFRKENATKNCIQNKV